MAFFFSTHNTEKKMLPKVKKKKKKKIIIKKPRRSEENLFQKCLEKKKQHGGGKEKKKRGKIKIKRTQLPSFFFFLFSLLAAYRLPSPPLCTHLSGGVSRPCHISAPPPPAPPRPAPPRAAPPRPRSAPRRQCGGSARPRGGHWGLGAGEGPAAAPGVCGRFLVSGTALWRGAFRVFLLFKR